MLYFFKNILLTENRKISRNLAIHYVLWLLFCVFVTSQFCFYNMEYALSCSILSAATFLQLLQKIGSQWMHVTQAKQVCRFSYVCSFKKSITKEAQGGNLGVVSRGGYVVTISSSFLKKWFSVNGFVVVISKYINVY